MTTNFKHFLALALVGLGIQGAVQAAPTFEHVKTIDLNPTKSTTDFVRITAAASDANGIIYFVDNVSDKIYSFDPLAFTGISDLNMIENDAPQTNQFSSSSYTGITVDKTNGNIYAAGPSRNATTTPNNAVITKLTKSGSTWTPTYLNRTDSIPLSGVQSVGENQLVFSNPKTGDLYFFEFDTGTSTLVAKGSATGNNSIWAPSLAVDTINKKIYQGRGSGTAAKAADVDVFSYSYPFSTGSNNFAATRIGNYLPGQTTLATAAQPLQYQSIAINSTNNLLAIPVNLAAAGATSTTTNPFEVYDISGATPVKVATLDGLSTPDANAMRADNKGYGVTFFKQGGKEYLLTFYSSVSNTTVTPWTSRISRGYIYEVKTNSDIDTWNMY